MALLCYDYALRPKPDFHLRTISDIEDALHPYLQYSNLLRSCSKAPPDDKDQQQLLGYRPDPSPNRRGKFVMGASSILCEAHGGIGQDKLRCSRPELARLVPKALNRRFNERLRALHDALAEAPALKVCLQFTAFGTCEESPCESSHLDVMTQKTYVERLLVHLHIISLLNRHVEITPGDGDWRSRQGVRTSRSLYAKYYRIIGSGYKGSMKYFTPHITALVAP